MIHFVCKLNVEIDNVVNFKGGWKIMINSEDRKLVLSGWLKNNDITSYNISLKLQKFIFFYECACKVKNKKYSFAGLKGYKKGPVFSAVWGDYTKDRDEFNKAADDQYKKNRTKIIDSEIVKKIDFFIKTCNEEELSGITHTMNIWKSKKDRILSDEPQVPLDDADFNSNDENLIKNILSIYPLEMINKSKTIQISNTIFILSKEDSSNLTPTQMDTLQELANEESLDNPVYVSIDPEKKGRLLID